MKKSIYISFQKRKRNLSDMLVNYCWRRLWTNWWDDRSYRFVCFNFIWKFRFWNFLLVFCCFFDLIHRHLFVNEFYLQAKHLSKVIAVRTIQTVERQPLDLTVPLSHHLLSLLMEHLYLLLLRDFVVVNFQLLPTVLMPKLCVVSNFKI